MKMYQLYVCEHCGKESRDVDEIERCEASHMGLTVEEKHTWHSLNSAVNYFGSVVYTTNNERTRAAFDKAVEKLVLFEKEHNIISQ